MYVPHSYTDICAYICIYIYAYLLLLLLFVLLLLPSSLRRRDANLI